MAEADRPATCPDGHSRHHPAAVGVREHHVRSGGRSQPGAHERRGLLRRGLRLRLT